MATNLDEFAATPAPPPEYQRALAREYIATLTRIRDQLSGVARDHFDFEVHDALVQLAAEAGVDIDVPAGRPDPDFMTVIHSRVGVLNAQLAEPDVAADPAQAAVIQVRIEQLSQQYQRMQSATSRRSGRAS